jgi:hypothetical protein
VLVIGTHTNISENPTIGNKNPLIIDVIQRDTKPGITPIRSDNNKEEIQKLSDKQKECL